MKAHISLSCNVSFYRDGDARLYKPYDCVRYIDLNFFALAGIENLAENFLITVSMSERNVLHFITLLEIFRSNDSIGLRADSRSPKKLVGTLPRKETDVLAWRARTLSRK